MSKKGSRDTLVRYEVITKEDPESGDLYLPIPLPLLKQLGWEEGDSIDFKVDDQGRYIISRIKK